MSEAAPSRYNVIILAVGGRNVVTFAAKEKLRLAGFVWQDALNRMFLNSIVFAPAFGEAD